MQTKKVQLNGLLPPEYTPTKERLIVDIKTVDRSKTSPREVIANDARILQAKSASPAEFFAKHGFVLLDAPTGVTDWDEKNGQVESIYFTEVELALRDKLFPATRHMNVSQMPQLFMRRGVGTQNPRYVQGVHQDYGWTAADFEETVAAFTTPDMGREWRAQYEADSTVGFAVINFWRTTGMTNPLEHMPLILAEPSTIRHDDLIPYGLTGITPTGKPNNQMLLRYNPDQKWYWYPNMRPNEVLVFKLFESSKADKTPIWRTVFHSAFIDPDADVNAERRQSCEHRVQVTFSS